MGSSGEDTAGAAPGFFFVAGKLQGLGWVGIKARRERSGHGGCGGVPGAAWGSGTSPRLSAAPQGQEVGDKPAEDPSIYPGITSHPEGFTAELRELQRDPDPGIFPGLALGSSIRDSLDPNPALSRLPGEVWGSTGMSFHGNETLEEARSILCAPRYVLDLGNGVLEPARSITARPGQPRTAGGLPKVLLQPQLSPGMPSAVHSSGNRPGAGPAPLCPKPTTQTRLNGAKPPRTHRQERLSHPSLGSGSHLRHLQGGHSPLVTKPRRLCPAGSHFPAGASQGRAGWRRSREKRQGRAVNAALTLRVLQGSIARNIPEPGAPRAGTQQLQGCPRDGSLGFIQRQRPGSASPSSTGTQSCSFPPLWKLGTPPALILSPPVAVTSPWSAPAASFPARCPVRASLQDFWRQKGKDRAPAALQPHKGSLLPLLQPNKAPSPEPRPLR